MDIIEQIKSNNNDFRSTQNYLPTFIQLIYHLTKLVNRNLSIRAQSNMGNTECSPVIDSFETYKVSLPEKTVCESSFNFIKNGAKKKTIKDSNAPTGSGKPRKTNFKVNVKSYAVRMVQARDHLRAALYLPDGKPKMVPQIASTNAKVKPKWVGQKKT